jgi:short-subunit dehydrogenase
MRQLVRTVAIAGASAGLGEALAPLYADTDRTLGLLWRNCGRLEAVGAHEIGWVPASNLEAHASDLGCAAGSARA